MLYPMLKQSTCESKTYYLTLRELELKNTPKVFLACRKRGLKGIEIFGLATCKFRTLLTATSFGYGKVTVIGIWNMYTLLGNGIERP